MLDIRPAAAFRAGHLAGSASHPLDPAAGARPGEGMEEALPSIFLPPREEPLLLVAGDAERGALLARSLKARGRSEVDAAVLPEGGTGLPPGLSWERGDSRRQLWRPPAWLARHEGLLPPPAAGPVLDLACGSGRSAVWLADRGYRVTGVDWQPEALELGRSLAASRGVRCRFLPGDLRDPGALPAGGPWSVVLSFRFLQRELFSEVHRLLRPAGVVLVRTFRDAPGRQGRLQSRHRLGPAELVGFFPPGRFEILAHEESHDPDGRPAAGIVARRRFVLPGRDK